MIEVLISLFERDMTRLRSEIEAYKNEDNLWRLEGEILNTGGNLCLHLVGNLNSFIGAELGNTGYIRNRPNEFGLKNIPRSEMLEAVDHCKEMITSVLGDLSELDLKSDYPKIVFQDKMTIGYFLVHLSSHLMYHLGQINYHRRLLDVE